jgi:SAM-dependent methyltransferase
MRLLDLGSGTGNAALEAARRGAVVTAVDPARRLVAVSLERAEEAGLTLTATVGDASQIPARDRSFDVVVSVFAVIFAPDAERAASEMLRVVRPGGRVIVTSWVPEGPIAEAGAILRDAMRELDPSSGARQTPAWGEPGFVRRLFEPRGATVSIEEDTISFEAESPEAWFEEQEQHHPIWRSIREALAGVPGAWNRVRERSIEKLHAGNESPPWMRMTSRYLVITAVRSF